MLGLFKIKALFVGLLIASPAFGFLVLRAADTTPERPIPASAKTAIVASAQEKITRIPVEVISKGAAPEWVYVSVENQAVPEPGSACLILLTGLLMVFRRQR